VKTIDVLRGVRALFTAADRWTQKKDAKDDLGLGCPALATRASCWCLAGAVQRVTVQDMPGVAICVPDLAFSRTIIALARSIDPACTAVTMPSPPLALNVVTAWNDSPTRTFDEILAVVDRAIADELTEAA